MMQLFELNGQITGFEDGIYLNWKFYHLEKTTLSFTFYQKSVYY